MNQAHWQHRLDELAAKHGVPGAQLGILRGEDLLTLATGVLHVGTGQPAATDSVWQIGSISKVWTATVIMQLIDEGRFTLRTPVAEVLPEFRLRDPETTAAVTVWHLLTHTSGIDGDLFTDTGRGDDALEKYVALLADSARNHPIGATWSYCNAGYSVLGRIIEVATGQTWDQAIREKLFTPLGLTRTTTLPEDAMVFGHAMGHVKGGDEPVVAPVWGLPRAVGPAGLITSTVAEVLAFARMHLRGGLAADGTRVLSAESAAAMSAYQTDCPEKRLLGDSWGLGWFRCDWHGHRAYGHDGNTIGQAAFLRVLPEAGVAVALLTNGGHTHDLYVDLYDEIFAELTGVRLPEPFEPPAEPITTDLAPYAGTYERESVRMEVFDDDGKPTLRTILTGPLAGLEDDPVQTYEMTPVEPGLYAVRPEGMETWVPVTFYSLPTGEEYVHYGARATPKKLG
ncbi:beta-lactamase family protein [Herbidospora galbida]|uniref:Beta-lactamase family protein n=1 Tax=Herbidospora galbida TaxID=2575442 RepID=A0A4U3LSL3_9ACTN|nr:serine hydrolase domain-containing protein [Herbidospora galbida]TKK78985.1 beta-lactamase family protein [Herbidospora galbida]